MNVYPTLTRANASESQPMIMSELSNRLDGDASRSPKDLLLRLNNEENSMAHVPSFSLTDKREDTTQYSGASYQGGGISYPSGFSYRISEKLNEMNPGEATGQIFSCKHLSEHQIPSRNQMEYNSSIAYPIPGSVPLVPPHLPNRTSSIPKPRQIPLVVPKSNTVAVETPVLPSSSHQKTFDDSPRIDTQSSHRRLQQQPQQISTSTVLPKYPVQSVSGSRALSKSKHVQHYGSRQSGYNAPSTSEAYRVYHSAHQSSQPTRSNPTVISSEEAPDGTFEISV